MGVNFCPVSVLINEWGWLLGKGIAKQGILCRQFHDAEPRLQSKGLEINSNCIYGGLPVYIADMRLTIQFLLVFYLLSASFFAYAKPYYSEFVEKQDDKDYIVVFHGEINEADEPRIKILERKYLEHLGGDFLEYKHLRWQIASDLKAFGIEVEVIEDSNKQRAEKIQNPAEFHHLQTPEPDEESSMVEQ